jgi:pimeloyl-ACP methyl ester carboxylesterase
VRARLSLIVGLLLLLGGATLAQRVQSDGSAIAVQDVRFTGASGTPMSALLYVPPNARRDTPAPGILAVHGYINSRETQSGFAIEFARRGYVVVALDQTGHGFSAPPAFANGFGGPDGLTYLRSLKVVDPERIGLEGHSMGGWAVLSAAATQPQAYRAVVLEGSAPGVFGAPTGTPDFPRNVAVVFSAFDEFADLMWGVPLATSVGAADKLLDLFNATALVEAGRVYGDIAQGTARVWLMPNVTHPGEHHSRAAIGHAIDWFEQTLGAPNALPSDDQVWYWKEVGTFAMLIAVVVLMIGFTTNALPLVGTSSPPRVGAISSSRIDPVSVLATALLPAITYLPFFKLADVLLPPSGLFPQQITNGVTLWLIGNALLTVLWLRVRPAGDAITFDLPTITRAFVAALVGVGVTYAALFLVAKEWSLDARVWVLAVKPLATWHWGAFFAYVVPMLVFFPLLGIALSRAWPGIPPAVAALMLPSGFVLFLLIQYVPLFTGHAMPFGEPLLTVIAFQFVGLLAIVGIVAVVFARRTGDPWTGGFVNALFVAWVVVAGQATHV